MREARLVMPFTTVGSHDQLRSDLVTAFGGFTCVVGLGGWASPSGEVISEPVVVYDIAMGYGRLGELALIAHRTATQLKQHSVYYRDTKGVVYIEEVSSGPNRVPYARDLTPAERAGAIAPPPHEASMLQAQREAQREAQGIREVENLPER